MLIKYIQYSYYLMVEVSNFRPLNHWLESRSIYFDLDNRVVSFALNTFLVRL